MESICQKGLESLSHSTLFYTASLIFWKMGCSSYPATHSTVFTSANPCITTKHIFSKSINLAQKSEWVFKSIHFCETVKPVFASALKPVELFFSIVSLIALIDSPNDTNVLYTSSITF